MRGFSVTFDLYTQESVADGDASESGYLLRDGTLREALNELMELPALDVIEPNCWPISKESPPSAFYATQGSEWPLYAEDENDAGESRALHLPDSVTPSSRLRIARLLQLEVED